MSFMRTLATVAVGFAAAKGLDQYKKMGGMAGMQDMMKTMSSGVGGQNPIEAMTVQMGQMAEKMGMGDMMAAMKGGGNPMGDMMAQMGRMGSDAAGAGAAGLAGLMSSFQGAAAASGGVADDMMSAMFGGTAASVAQEENAKLMLRAMIQAAKADGEIDADEQATILDALGDVSPEERAFVERELAAPLDPVGLAQDAGQSLKAQVYATSLTAMKVDTGAEVGYLDQLAQALQLDHAERARIHAAMGVPMA